MKTRLIFQNKILALFLFGIILFCASNAFSAPSLPGPADAGRALKDKEKKFQDIGAAPEKAPSIKAPALPGYQAPQGAENVTFVLRSIEIKGSTIYQKSDLAPLYKSSLGKTVTVDKIYEFAALLTQRYRNDGYALSRAVVPPQEIESGAIKIVVIEGYIDTLTIVGDYKATAVSDNIIGKVMSEKPLNMKTLERQMLLLNDLPGIAAQAILKPVEDDSDLGATKLVLAFGEESAPVSISFDNFGSRYLGPYEASIHAAYNFFPQQQTQIDGLVTTPTDELQFIQISHKLPISSEGTMASFSASYGHSAPGYSLESQEIRGNSYDYNIGLSQPIIRTRSENLYLGAGLEVRNSKVDVLATELYEDKLRILSVSGNYDVADAWRGANQLELKLSQGVDAFGATDNDDINKSRIDGRSDFTKVTADANGQYSWSPLLSSEQFGLGGQQFGRAYDSSELTGDSGIAGSLELQYSGLPYAFDTESQLYTFYDSGKAWSEDGPDSSLSSAGAGVRLAHASGVSGNFSLAKPLTKKVDAPSTGNGKDVRFLFSLSYKLDNLIGSMRQ